LHRHIHAVVAILTVLGGRSAQRSRETDAINEKTNIETITLSNSSFLVHRRA
jgi:hypothetical protein